MRLRTLILCVLATLTSISTSLSLATTTTRTTQFERVNFVDVDSGRSGGNLTPKQRLCKAVDLAKAGNLEQAFGYALETASQNRGIPMFSVEYIDTLVKISKLSTDGLERKILNEAIRTVNSVKGLESFSGKENPETAYHFTGSIHQLAKEIIKIDKTIGMKLKIFEGRLARNLSMNSQYPANAKEALAGFMISSAEGYAMLGKQERAMAALTSAVDVGFGDFPSLFEPESAFRELDDQDALKQHVGQLKKTYLARVKIWSQNAVASFQRFPMPIRVDNVDGGTLDAKSFRDKVLVVDLWATWCAPCREGIPHFIELQKTHADKVQVLGVSMDSPDDPTASLETVKKFMADEGFNYPCGLGTDSLSKQIPGDVRLPTTLFIDRSGDVRYIARGFHDHAKLAAITETLANEGQQIDTTNIR